MIAKLSLITTTTDLCRMKTSITILKMRENTMLLRKKVDLSKLLKMNNSNTGSKKRTISNQTGNKIKHTRTGSNSH